MGCSGGHRRLRPAALAWEDHIELLPVRWQPVNDYGIRFDYRTYDSTVLNGHRRARTSAGAAVQLEVHHNPYDPARIWVRLPDGFQEVPWIHATQVSMPFTDAAWRHIISTVARTTDRDAHEVALARALDTLLRRAGAGTGTRRERTIAARAAAAASLALDTLVPAPADTTTAGGAPEQRGEGSDVEDAQRFQDPEDLAESGFDEGDDEGEEGCVPDPGPPRPTHVLNPYQEAQQWL